MRTKRNWLRTTIAMLTLVATVLETGFSSVQTFAAEITTEDGIVVNNDAVEEVPEENLDITVEPDNGGDADFEVLEASEDDAFEETLDENPDVEAYSEEVPEEAKVFEEAEELLEGTLDVSDGGITGSGYDEISVYVDTDELDNRDKFRIEFTGPASAIYNPVLNEDLDKTNDGRYDFDSLEGGEFTIRANSSDDVILSYSYNEDGYPLITVKSEETEKVLTTKILTAEDDSRISAVSGEGYDSVTVEFATEKLSDKAGFKLIVESVADATVDGNDAKAGITGLSKDTGSLVIDNLDGESFVAYVVSDSETKLETVAEVVSTEDGRASIEINDVATKRVYEYEDAKIYVRATLEKADAVPDDAYFGVTPLTEAEAEAYLAALNADYDKENEIEEEHDPVYTAENTLLYDIAFYTDESKEEELEPEEGSVVLSVEFKNNQLENDLGVETTKDVEVTHFIGDDSIIEPEKLEVERGGEDTSLEVVTESFSVFAFTGATSKEVEVENPGEESATGILGDAWLYGITAEEWVLTNDAETSFAVKTFTVSGHQTGTTDSQKGGDSNYQYNMVGHVNGSGTQIKGYDAKVTIPKGEKSKIWHSNGEAHIEYDFVEKNTIDRRIDAMLSYVNNQSSRMYGKDSVKSYFGVPARLHNKLTLDITKAEAGTYYINVDKYPELRLALSDQAEGLSILKNDNQKIVFNFGETSVKTMKFNVNGQGSDGLASLSTSHTSVVEDIIFNMPNATTVDLHCFVGILIAPNAEVTVAETSGGWLVCKKAIGSGGEWHFLNGRVFEPTPGKTSLTIPVSKRFLGGEGKWNDGFEFTIEKSKNGWSNWQKVEDVSLDETTTPNPKQYIQNIVINGGQAEDASGSFTINYNDRILNRDGLNWNTNTNRSEYDNYEQVAEEWYRITEIKDNRGDVEYNIHDAKDDADNEISDYWFVHVFIYKDFKEGYWGNRNKTAVEYKVVKRTARVDPNRFNWSHALPCEEDRDIWFINKYTTKEIPVELELTKQINDGQVTSIPDNAFEFQLVDYADGEFNNVIETKSNVDGGVKFASLTLNWDQADGYNKANNRAYFYYLIRESQSVEPYIKDNTVYIAKVTLNKESGNVTFNRTRYYKFTDGNPDISVAQAETATFKCNECVFNNTYTATGSTKLYGHKKIENRKFKDGDKFTFTLTPNTEGDPNKAQTIEITPSAADNYDYDFEFAPLNYTFADAGKTFNYTIAETAGSDGNITYSTVTYPVNVTVTDNKTGTLMVTPDGATERNRANFTNVYGAKGDVQFQTTKQYASSALAANKKFSFTLTDVTNESAPVVLGTKEVTGQDTVTFDKIDYADISKAGTYKYTIKEVIPAGATDLDSTHKIKDGIIYDDRTYNITVVVTDNTSGKLETEITGAFDNGDTAADVKNPVFVNDYAVSETTGSLGGIKELHGKELNRGDFTFNLATADSSTANAVEAGNVVMPTALSVKNGVPDSLDKNAFKFEDITFKAAGVYSFVITEEAGSEEDIEYSTASYTVAFDVRDNGEGQLYIASRSRLDSDNIFINTKSGNGQVQLFARKVLTGRKLEAEQFTFELKDKDGVVIDTKSNDASGNVAFDLISYNNNSDGLALVKAGDTATFEYTISEVGPAPAGYTYDTHEQNVKVTVTLNADGSLNAVADNATLNVPAVFNNTYTASGTVQFDGTKKITGREFDSSDEGKFHAELYNEAGELVERTDIHKDTKFWGENGGKFAFTALNFTQEDLKVGDEYVKTVTKNYTVKETGAAEKIRMDQSVYDVAVTITDNGDGTLNVQKQYSLNGAGLGAITFVNEFTTSGQTSFTAKKTVSGTVLKGKRFSFELKDSTGKVIDTAENGDGGEIIFKTLTYSQDDVAKSPIVYTISEKEKTRAGYTLDERVYTAKAFLTLDPATGELSVEKKYYDANSEEVTEANVIFENVYTGEGNVELYANKKLTGRDLAAGIFTFNLYNEDGSPAGTATNVKAQAGAVAKAAFPVITYSEADLNEPASHKVDENTYARYYTIREQIPEGATADNNYTVDGYTYDPGVYNVVVTLEDKGNGTIDTDWYAYKTGTLPEKPSFWDKVIEFVTGKGANKNALFENEYKAEGALELSAKKTLTGKALKADDFAFELTGKDEEGANYSDSKANDADGNVKFDKITYTKPGEYEYTIKEKIPTNAVKGDDGFYVLNGVRYDATEYKVNVSVTDPGNGKLAVTATINGGSAVTSVDVTDTAGKVTSVCTPAPVSFINNYSCKPVDVTLGGTKMLVGRDLANENEFSFTMKSAAGNPKAFDQTVNINKGVNGAFGSFGFDTITFTFDDMKNSDDTYADEKPFEYEISEVVPKEADELEGVTYDSNTYNVVITVTNKDGILSAKVTSNEAVLTDTLKAARFVNTYDADDKLILPVKKLVEGTNDTSKVFTFELTGDVDEKMTTTAVKDQVSTFAPITYRLSDIKNTDGTYNRTYNYTVSEVKGSEPGYTYSQEVYKVKVVVTSDGKSGKLNIDKTITKNGETYENAAMEFTNTYTAKGETTIEGTKTLVGRDLVDGKFEFVLSQKGEDGKYSEIQKKANENGAFSYKLEYDQNDVGNTYYYQVNEVIPDDASEGTIDYDTSVYDITVSVADRKDGTLEITKDIRKGSATSEVCSFTNKEINPGEVIFEAKKTLTGKAIGDDMFEFTLKGDGQDQTVMNKGEAVTFNAIEYSYKDIGKKFTYTIEEKGKSGDGITYDTTKYVATVEVKGFDDERNLIIEKTIKKNGNTVNEITFENKYESETKVQFGGHKHLVGFEDGKTPLGTYTFGLYNALGGEIETQTVTPAKATDSTEYSFGEITYNQDDYLKSAETGHKFTYTVKEIVPVQKAANVTYAENEYNITVELYYDINGLLQARESTAQGVAVTDLDFTNKYQAEGEVIIDGEKTIKGKNLVNGAYTFTLTGEGQNQEVKNSGNAFTFEKIKYEAKDIGEHVYTVVETATTDGSTKDSSEFTVTVTVKEGSNGQLSVEKSYSRKDKDGVVSSPSAISFENTYNAKGSVTFEGRKIMHNKPLMAGDFSFVLKDENGTVLQTKSHDKASLNRASLMAEAPFSFDTIEYTQEDLKAADGSYLSEVKKYYTVEEVASNKAGVTYSTAVYVIEVTIKSDKTENLVVTKKVRNKNEITEEVGGIRGFFAKLAGNTDEKDVEIVFENEYDAVCVIDPPILTKQVLGRDIERGKYWFKVDSPDGLVSMGEFEKGYHRHVANGYGVSGALMHDPGEIAVDDLKYHYTDLLAFDDAVIDLETGRVEKTFVYTATEDDESVVAGVTNSPAVFTLTFTVYDIGDGELHRIPERIEDLKWVQQTPNALTDDEYKDVFLNIFNQEGSIDLVGVKKLDGRKLTQNDKFEFVLTDDATGKTVTVNNTNDKFGVPSVVAFNASEIDFLNYRWGVFADEKNELRKYDDRGDHTYTVEETFYGINGIVSDTSKFKIIVNVTEAVDANGEPLLDATGKHGRLNVAVTKVEKIISENNKESFDHADGNFFEFKNEFKATGKTELDGIKYLKDQAGNALASPDSMLDQYEFALYSYEDAARTIGKTLVSVAKTSANGSFKLDIPEYTQEVLKDEKGEYADEKTLYYRLVEVKPSSGVWTENNTIFESDGVVYDNTEYDVDVNVKFNGTQKLDVSKTIRKADTGEAITSISYTNIVKEYTTVEGNKYWVDNIKDPSQRPDVTVNLYRRTASGVETKINSYTIVAPDTTYRFATDDKGNKLPTYDSAGRPISYVVEELPITGYLSEKVNYDFYNTAGDILIRKIDADTRAPLSGAVLAIFDGSTEIERWTSGTSAHVIESALTAGKTYTLREITAPEGYGVAEDMTFTVPADGSSITVTMSDPPIIGSVRLTKRDASTRETLAGAEFALYNDAGTRIYATGTPGSYSATTSTSNGVFVTDSAGTLTISDLPYGTYYFVETKAPEGYALSSERLGFTILRSGELVEVTYLNTKATGSVRLRKVGSDGTRSLAGAVFELYAATPRSIGQAASSTIFSDAYFRYGTYRTNSAGELYVGDLPWDDYYFIEVEAPDGYETATDVNGDDLVYTFTISAASADRTIDLGGIVNTPERPPITPPPGPTPTPTPGVLGARVKRGGVVNGVLGVRAKPSSGVLGVRVGPVTGDASNIILWLLLLTACVATIVATIVTGRKKKTATK